MEITWVDGHAASVPCPLCGSAGPHPSVVRYRAPYGAGPLRYLLRCAGCGSLFLDDLAPPPHVEDSPAVRHHIDFYVGLSAGVDVMADLLYKIDTAGVERFLEIGCGYGLSLDYARATFGWQVAGIDPGIIARSGARDLGLDIGADYVLPGYDFRGRRFDLMLCSEVVEHVPDPPAFLAALRAGLADGGVLLLTTPDAEHVRPDTPMSALLPILQPGFHLVLLTAESLDRALREAGFDHVEVWAQGATLVAAAADRALAVHRAARVDAGHYRAYLERFLEGRAASPLTEGMAFRLLKHTTTLGDMRGSDRAFARVRALIREVHGIDVGRPERMGLGALPVLSFDELGAHLPFALACVLYHRGIARLITGAHREAAEYFRAAAAAAVVIRRALHSLSFDDGDTEAAGHLARVHLPMALAHVDPAAALDALAEIEEAPAPDVPAALWALPPALLARARHETFTRLVSLGRYAAAERIAAAVRDDLGPEALAGGPLAPGPGPRVAAAFCLAMLMRNHLGDLAAAARLFGAVRDACEARLADAPDDAQALDLGEQARRNQEECRAAAGEAPIERAARGRGASQASTDPPIAPARTPGGGVAHRAAPARPSAASAVEAAHARPSPELLLDQTIELAIVAAQPGWSGFALRLGTFGSVNACGLEVSVEGGRPARTLASGAFPTEALFDNGHVLFHFRARGPLARGPYTIRLRSPGARPGNCLAVYPEVTEPRHGPPFEGGGAPMLLREGELVARPLGDGTSPSHVQATVLRYWIDGWGAFVEGHLAWDGVRPEAFSVGVAGQALTALALEPVDARTLRFHGYVARPAGAPLIAGVRRGGADETLPLAMTPLPPLPELRDPGLFSRFVAAMDEMGGTVVEIGSNLGHATSLSQRRFFAAHVRYVGVDIHADANTDLVADAHQLASAIAPGSVQGVFSLSVLEHLAAPWLVAVEVNRVLAPGGLVYHQTHQTWPPHAYPNDFWRFTDEALRHLFGPAFGYEVIEATMAHPIVCHPTHRVPEYLDMPFLPGHGGAYVLARKVREVTAVPSGADLAEMSRRYPQLGRGPAAR